MLNWVNLFPLNFRETNSMACLCEQSVEGKDMYHSPKLAKNNLQNVKCCSILPESAAKH